MTGRAGAPNVTVAILNRGRRAELRRLIVALGQQRFRDFAVVLVSDAPTAAALELGEAGRRLSFQHLAEANVARARNLALAHATGDIIAFCDDDAVPEPGWLAALIAPFEDPKVGAAGGFVRGRNGVSFQWRGTAFDRTGTDSPLPLSADGPVALFPPEAGRFVKTVGTNAAFRVAALRAIGGFDEAYAFFLDETDANLRLSEAGWWTAVVPGAEVHHSFAASAQRAADRVPRTLCQTAFSKGYFLARHAPTSTHGEAMEAFRQSTRRQVHRAFALGLLAPSQVRPLLDEVARGLEEGRLAPEHSTPALGMSAENGLHFATSAREAPRIAVLAEPWGLAEARDRAAALAAEGAETTLLAFRPSLRPLTVRFDPAGYWLHQGGIWGRTERTEWRIRLDTLRNRWRMELSRIAAQRMFTTILGSDGRECVP
ncbi:MAG: glycosyltransferase [Pseudomonadota bacterium]